MKLGEITLNGKTVSVFEPPHAEPDFPWVDVEELAKAFLPRAAAKRMVHHTHRFGGDKRSYATVANGDRIATIICHALAQGLCGAIDEVKGHRGDAEDGPAHSAYCLALGMFAADHWPMDFKEIIHAFHNPGGVFLRDMKEGIMNEPPDFKDLENDLLGAVEMGDAVYSLLEAGCQHGLDARQAVVVLRCVSHLQDHAEAALKTWTAAVAAG